MRITISLLLLILSATYTGFSTSFTIVNSGFTFSPENITINAGDTVNFVLASIHTAREVSKATWDANGNTSNGGFDLPAGGGTVVLTQVGIHYYVCVPHAANGMKGTITVNAATGIKSKSEATPGNFSLMQNYPNPFNPSTIITFTLPSKSYALLTIFDALGRKVSNVVTEELPAGTYIREWNASGLPNGVYYYRLQAGTFTETRKLLLLK